MGDLKSNDDKRDELEQTEDTEGHALLIDPYSARKLDNSRVADRERESRARQLREDAKRTR